MKLRLKALLLVLGIFAFAFSALASAEETEQLPAAEELEEAVSEEDESEAAAVTTVEGSDDEAEDITEEEYYSEMLSSYLSMISAWDDAMVNAYMDSEDEVTALVAYNWSMVKSELGNFEEITQITDIGYSDDGYGGSVTGIASYDGTGKGSTVYVTLEYEYTYSSTYGQYVMDLTDISWDVQETMGRMMRNAAMNTVMGVCIVFAFLVVLSFLIGRIRYIPEMIEKRNQNGEEEEAPKPAPAAEAEVKETPADDLELIAVITAAVEAARSDEPTASGGDSYVVRSIKKINNRNWHRA